MVIKKTIYLLQNNNILLSASNKHLNRFQTLIHNFIHPPIIPSIAQLRLTENHRDINTSETLTPKQTRSFKRTDVGQKACHLEYSKRYVRSHTKPAHITNRSKFNPFKPACLRRTVLTPHR